MLHVLSALSFDSKSSLQGIFICGVIYFIWSSVHEVLRDLITQKWHYNIAVQGFMLTIKRLMLF